MEMHDLYWNGQKKKKTDLLQKTFLSEREKNIWFSCFNSAYSDQIDWEIESEDQFMEYCIWINFISFGSLLWFYLVLRFIDKKKRQKIFFGNKILVEIIRFAFNMF